MAVTEKVYVTPPQMKIISSPKRFKIVNAGRRFGKSFLAGYMMLAQCINKAHARVWYIAPTLPEARDIMWIGWLKEHVPQQYIQKKNEQMMIIEFKNGSILQLKTADDPDHLRGSGIDLVVIDEAAMIKDEDFWEIITPVLSDKWVEGKALIISTPKGYNWFYTLYQKAEFDDEWDRFQYTTLEGGNVRPEEIEKRKKTMSKKMFEQEYLASFETLSNRVYYNFDKDKNCISELEDWMGKGGDIHCGIDFNVNPMTSAIFVETTNEKREKISIQIDEIVEPNSDTQDLADKIKDRYPNCTVYCYPDPTCHKRQSNAVGGVTDYDILEKNGFIVCCPSHPYGSKDKWNTVNTALCNAAEERHVFVYRKNCVETCKSLEGYTYKKGNKTEPDKSSGLDHISDAFAYYINYALPMKNKKLRRPEVLGV